MDNDSDFLEYIDEEGGYIESSEDEPNTRNKHNEDDDDDEGIKDNEDGGSEEDEENKYEDQDDYKDVELSTYSVNLSPTELYGLTQSSNEIVSMVTKSFLPSHRRTRE